MPQHLHCDGGRWANLPQTFNHCQLVVDVGPFMVLDCARHPIEAPFHTMGSKKPPVSIT